MDNLANPILTERQRLVLQYIEHQINIVGYPPTVREIGRFLGIRSTNGVNEHLRALQKKGYLAWEGQKSRTLRLLGVQEPKKVTEKDATASSQKPANHIPFFMDLKQLKPFFSAKDADNWIELPRMITNEKDTFSLIAARLSDDSMTEDGLLPGDVIFIGVGKAPQVGERVVVHVNETTLLRRYFPEGERIRLQPAKSGVQPLFVRRDELAQWDILGVAAGLIRRL